MCLKIRTKNNRQTQVFRTYPKTIQYIMMHARCTNPRQLSVPFVSDCRPAKSALEPCKEPFYDKSCFTLILLHCNHFIGQTNFRFQLMNHVFSFVRSHMLTKHYLECRKYLIPNARRFHTWWQNLHPCRSARMHPQLDQKQTASAEPTVY